MITFIKINIWIVLLNINKTPDAVRNQFSEKQHSEVEIVRYSL